MIALVAALALAPDPFRLWTGDAPGALGTAEKDIPTLTPYVPAHPCGSAVIVCPGGGYEGLADHEGSAYALFLNRLGVTAFVLKYRLGSSGYRYPVELWDVQRAIRMVRFEAKKWKIDPKRIGVMGSSAGGHLTSMAVTRFDGGDRKAKDPIDRVSSRPDFGILCYAVISMGPTGHAGSRRALLGDNPSQALIDETSSEKQVKADTPPCFLWHTQDDPVVPVANSEAFATALQEKNVPYELHLYPHGPHGMGLGGPPTSNTLLPWTHELTRWMVKHKWARKLDGVSN
ncbi:MAG TPA: alpha/beta hydrolase [Fimbriimonadaceae bacterium]|nr:alpha/beta hydrolase [Fimbriimonadaceae bacterium]